MGSTLEVTDCAGCISTVRACVFAQMSEAADHNMIEQAMADMLFHVEKDVDGEAEILKRAEEENGTTTKLPAAGKR